jgi:tetratricopeptide (TPR) repeat protein
MPPDGLLANGSSTIGYGPACLARCSAGWSVDPANGSRRWRPGACSHRGCRCCCNWRALDVDDLAELTGSDLNVPVEMFTGPTHSALEAVRAALTEYRLDPPTPRVDNRHLAVRLEHAWTIRHSSPDHRTAVGSVLPGLIRDAQRAVRATSGPDRRAARRNLAGVYRLADFYVAYQPAPELVWLVADRAITEAEEADDPYAIAGGTWALTQALRDAGRWDEALAVAARGVRALEHDRAPDDWRGLWGALNFESAYVHARRGKYGLAWSHWELANDVARQLGRAYRHTQTSFSQAVMEAHAVTLDVELRRAGDAARRAARFDPATIPSLPRRSRHLVEVARAHHQLGDKAATCGYLLAALNTAPETVQYNGFAREMTRALLAKPPTGLTAEVRELAAGVGVKT